MGFRFRHVFVITYGRSGSTLLVGILNSIPGVHINGENAGALVHIFKAAKAAGYAHGFISPEPDCATHPWYGASLISLTEFEQSLAAAFAKHVLNPPVDALMIGFKEIRHGRSFLSDQELGEYLDFLRVNFERPCFLFNVRRSHDVAQSAWWASDPFARRDIEELTRSFRVQANRHSDISYWVDYNQIAGNPETVKGLFDFLGAPFDRDRVVAIMQIAHSYAPSAEMRNKQRSLKQITRALVRRFGAWLVDLSKMNS